jgi:mono/diheme cytochrome c family protein
LYISDDMHGRIWRVTYQGSGTATVAAAPAAKSAAGGSAGGTPPEGTHPDAGRPDPGTLPVPPGATKEQVALGERIFHGEASGGTCGGCHGSDAKGSPIGPDLTSGKWLWGDGSLKSLADTITNGVMTPKEHPGAMPPLGGAALSAADVQAVAAYVWAIGHNKH